MKLRRPVQSELGRVWRAGGRPSTGNAEGFEGARAGLRIGRTSAGQSRTPRRDASHRPRPTVTSISPSSFLTSRTDTRLKRCHGTDTWMARRVEEAAGHRRGTQVKTRTFVLQSLPSSPGTLPLDHPETFRASMLVVDLKYRGCLVQGLSLGRYLRSSGRSC